MCTVVFFPLDGGGYLLGHNRDESVSRVRGTPPRSRRERGVATLAPLDPEGNGTWIGVNELGLTACILNASETNPSRLPPTPLSRGLILRGLLPLDSIDAAWAKLEEGRDQLRGVRAFHVVVAIRGGSRPGEAARARAGWFRWNGIDLSRGVGEGPALFVSSGFDQRGAERERGRQWRAFLESPPAGEREVPARVGSWLASHEPERGALSVCMHRSDAATVSRTIVTVSGGAASLAYHDGPPCDDHAADSLHALPLR